MQFYRTYIFSILLITGETVNMSTDILFKTEDYVFSYRVAGILEKDGCVLLQKPSNDPGYALPGGHVSIGETNAETLMREFREEMGARIRVDSLAWVGEIFFPWGNRPCHQICLYYRVSLEDETSIPLTGSFQGFETMEGRSFDLYYHWVPISELSKIELYPTQAKELLQNGTREVVHFVYQE